MPVLVRSCRWNRLGAVASILAAAGTAIGQDSVPATLGGNDALSAYDTGVQKTRFVVDLVGITTSWNNPILVGPVLKASRDTDPSFKTQILGSAAVSPSLAFNTSFASKNYSVWTVPGQGINPTSNAAPGSTIAKTGFANQFGIVFTDFSLNPTNIIGATVGRDSTSLTRLYVERTIAAVSRLSNFSADTATLSAGASDAAGDVFIRADNFNTLPATTNRVLGDNIVRINPDARGGTLNQLNALAGSNTATDAAATTYIVSNESTPTNVPSGVLQSGTGPFALVFDFSNRLRTGSSTANLTNLAAAHLGSGASGHRGNPSLSALSPLGGSAGTIATLSVPTSGSRVNAMTAAGINFGAAGAPPTVAAGTSRTVTMPSPINGPGGFSANVSNNASFNQYLSQVPFRGGNGLVGIGTNSLNQLVLAATATDPVQGDFIAVATSTGPTTATWTVAAYPNQPVLDGPSGATIGTLDTPATQISAPAVDKFGNVYFVASWKPNLSPVATGLFKAVTTGTGYKLEMLLSTGQAVAGANSGRIYTISSLALRDSDSLASGAFHHQHLIQEQAPTAQTSDPANIRAFGGLIVNAVITYNNGGVNEPYDAVLFVGPTAGTSCAADFNNSGSVSVQDIFDFLAAYFANSLAADFNHSGMISVQDIFDFLAAYFTPCV